MLIKSKIPGGVMDILQKLQTSGYESYLVGGSVRDLLLERTPKDFDICTAATPDEVKVIFNRVIETGIKFGTVTVLDGNIPVEVTTYRSKQDLEGQGTKGEFPNKVIGDVHRRDFTINALLFDGYKVIDLIGGKPDLNNKIIKAVDNPEQRFGEDPLRMLRAIRLACQLDFCIEANTEASIRAHAKAILKVSPERVRDELVKILLTGSPSRGIKLLKDTGLLQYLLPELKACIGFEHKNPYHDKDVFEHTLQVLEQTSNNLVLRLAALFHDIAKPQTFSVDAKGIGHFYNHAMEGSHMSRAILKALRFDNSTVEAVALLIKEHMDMPNLKRVESVKKWLNRVGKERAGLLLELKKADIAGSAPPFDYGPVQKLQEQVADILAKAYPLSIGDLALGGRDLIELGLKPGPEIGRILGNLLNAVLKDPQLNRRECLLELVKLESKKG